MTWARVEDGEVVHVVEQMTSRDPVWIQEPVTESVEQFGTELVDTGEVDEDGTPILEEQEVSLGFLEVEVDPPETHEVKRTVSVAQGWEMDPTQMQAWGYTEVVDVGRDVDRQQNPSPVEVVEGVPTRTWETVTDIIADPMTIPADDTTAARVTLRFGGDVDPWPARVDVEANGVVGDVAVLSSGFAHLDVTAQEPGQVEVTMDGRTITLTATEV